MMVFFLESSFAAFWPYPRGMQYCTGEGDGPKTSNIQRIWRSPIGGTTAPTIVDGRVYINNNGVINCLSILDGTPLWKAPFNSKGMSVNSPCGYYEGKIYFGNSSKVFCLDAHTGKQIWTYNAGLSCDSQVTIVYGRVIIGAGFKLLCFDAKTGKLIWSIVSKNPNSKFMTQRLVYKNKVYTVLNEYFCILDIMSGKVIKYISKVGNNYGCLLLGANVILKSTNQIISVNKDTNIIFRIISNLLLDSKQPCVSNSMFICTTNENKVLIFDSNLQNRREIDLKQHVGNTPSMLMSPISSNELVFIGTKNSKLIIINTFKFTIEKIFYGSEYNDINSSMSLGLLLIANYKGICAYLNNEQLTYYSLHDRLTLKKTYFKISIPNITAVKNIKSMKWLKISKTVLDSKGLTINGEINIDFLPKLISGKAYLLFYAQNNKGVTKCFSICYVYGYKAVIDIDSKKVTLYTNDNPQGEISYAYEKTICGGTKGKPIYFIDKDLAIKIVIDALSGISKTFKENILTIENKGKQKTIKLFVHPNSRKQAEYFEGSELKRTKNHKYINIPRENVMCYKQSINKMFLSSENILCYFGFKINFSKNYTRTLIITIR